MKNIGINQTNNLKQFLPNDEEIIKYESKILMKSYIENTNREYCGDLPSTSKMS